MESHQETSESFDMEWIARNPSNGDELARGLTTKLTEVPAIVARARAAQAEWAKTPLSTRADLLRRWSKVLASEADDWAARIAQEAGKPRAEGLMEIISSLDHLGWTIRRGRRALRTTTIGAGRQMLLLMGGAQVRRVPRGVVAIWGTWNYPMFLALPAIAQAVFAGNAVVFKASENVPGLCEALRQSFERASPPRDLVGWVFGGPEQGRALAAAAVDFGHFTGGTVGGRAVLSKLAERGVPAVSELSGFDPAIVLPDAPLKTTAPALVWSAFVGCGQTCVAVKRVYVVGDASPWIEALARHADEVRVGDPSRDQVDVGPMINPQARERFHKTIESAIAAGAILRAGGVIVDGPGAFYRPTVLEARDERPEQLLAGCFGPVVVVRGVPDEESAIAAANSSDFALAASVWGSSRARARRVASQIQAGFVCINDAVAPTGHAGAPFGGMKASGTGRVHGEHGLQEFCHLQAVTERGIGGIRPQLFPYQEFIQKVLKFYQKLFY